jgi:hypothetical protein
LDTFIQTARKVLADYYKQPVRYYHAIFHHLSFKKNYGKKYPTALLKNIYLVDKDDNRIEIERDDTWHNNENRSIVADYCWICF